MNEIINQAYTKSIRYSHPYHLFTSKRLLNSSWFTNPFKLNIFVTIFVRYVLYSPVPSKGFVSTRPSVSSSLGYQAILFPTWREFYEMGLKKICDFLKIQRSPAKRLHKLDKYIVWMHSSTEKNPYYNVLEVKAVKSQSWQWFSSPCAVWR